MKHVAGIKIQNEHKKKSVPTFDMFSLYYFQLNILKVLENGVVFDLRVIFLNLQIDFWQKR